MLKSDRFPLLLQFVCLFFDCIWLYSVKQENYSIQTESSLFILLGHYRHIFTAKNNIEFVNEFPCLLGHPCIYISCIYISFFTLHTTDLIKCWITLTRHIFNNFEKKVLTKILSDLTDINVFNS